MVVDTVLVKIGFAKNRLDEICDLVAQKKIATDANLRQQLVQEFFFHLLGAIEYLAQLVNEKRNLQIKQEYVSAHEVRDQLKKANRTDPLVTIFDAMSFNTRKEPFPKNPFSNQGLMYRLINYRNEIVHRNTNPFHFSLSKGPAHAEFWLDPRNHSIGKSSVCVDTDLSNMFGIVSKYINQALLII